MTRLSFATMAAVVITLGLVGCTSPDESPTKPSPTQTQSPTIFPTAETASPLPDNILTQTPEPTASSVTANITVAGTDVSGTTVSASGYVVGVVEDGGGCRYEFTDGTATLSATREGVANVSTTSCGLVELPLKDFASRPWTVTLIYSSPSVGSVSSTATTVELP